MTTIGSGSNYVEPLKQLGIAGLTVLIIEGGYRYATSWIDKNIFSIPKCLVRGGRMLGYFWSYENGYLALPRLPSSGLGLNGANQQ